MPSKHLVDPCTSLDVGDIKNSKKKKKRKEKETKSSCNGHSIKLDNVIDELKKEEMTQDIVAGGKQQQHADDKWVIMYFEFLILKLRLHFIHDWVL